MNCESSSVMTGIKKVGGKLKPSSWILEELNKKSMQDAFTFGDEDYDERSCISEPSKNTARRSKRTRQQPYWTRLEAKANEMAARQIDELTDIRQDKGVKSRASYRKTTPAVSSKSQGTRVADGNKVEMNGQKSDKKETKNTFVAGPSASGSKNDLRRAQLFTTPNSSTSKEISPRALMRSQGTMLPDTDADSTENEEALQNSNPVVRMGLKEANMKPGTKSDITECVIVKEEPASKNPRDWTVAQTVAAIIRMEPDISPEDIKAIRDHKINGKVLLKLSVHELVTYGKMKLGPAMMLSSLVEQWNTKSQELQ